MWSSSFSDEPLCKSTQAGSARIERCIALRDAQPHHRQLRRNRVKRRQRNCRDARFRKQSFREALIVASVERAEVKQLKVGAGGGGESESAAGERAAQTVALGLKKVGKVLPSLGRLLEIRRDRVLQGMRDAKSVELVNLAQLAGECGGRDAVSHSNAGSVQCLAEGKHREALCAQLGVRQHRAVRTAVEHDVLVDLVGQHQDIPATNDAGEGIKVRRGHRGARRIVRAIDDDETRARRDGRAHPIPIVAKIRRLQWQPDGARARKPDGGIVGVVGRVENDNLIRRADRRLNDRVERFGSAERDRNFRFRIRHDPVTQRNLARDLRAQFRAAFHRRVLIVPARHRGRHQLRDARIDIVIGKSLS